MKDIKKNIASVPYDEVMLKFWKNRPPEEMKEYIQIAFEDYEKDKDEKTLLKALDLAIRVYGGYTKLSKETHITREALHRAFSSKGNPKLTTFLSVVSAVGLHIKFGESVDRI